MNETSGGSRWKTMTRAATMPAVMMPICSTWVLLTAFVPPEAV